MLKTQTYRRKPFYIDAVLVTEDNLKEVARWCMGDVMQTTPKDGGDPVPFVKVRVHRPLNDRQTKAFVGDWVLYANKGYKVYTQQAFEKNFEPAENPDQETLFSVEV